MGYLATLLKQAGQPAEGILQAEQSLRLFQSLHRATPDVEWYGYGMSSALEQIGKCQTNLGHADEEIPIADEILEDVEDNAVVLETTPPERVVNHGTVFGGHPYCSFLKNSYIFAHRLSFVAAQGNAGGRFLISGS